MFVVEYLIPPFRSLAMLVFILLHPCCLKLGALYYCQLLQPLQVLVWHKKTDPQLFYHHSIKNNLVHELGHAGHLFISVWDPIWYPYWAHTGPILVCQFAWFFLLFWSFWASFWNSYWAWLIPISQEYVQLLVFFSIQLYIQIYIFLYIYIQRCICL